MVTPPMPDTRKEALERLVEAVEAGTATPDDFAAAFPCYQLDPPEGPWTTGEDLTAQNAYDGDLSAAWKLHDAVLPGWWWDVGTEDLSGTFFGRVEKEPREVIGHGPNPARAWLLAILRALDGED